MSEGKSSVVWDVVKSESLLTKLIFLTALTIIVCSAFTTVAEIHARNRQTEEFMAKHGYVRQELLHAGPTEDDGQVWVKN